jgi:hypothetical protein
MTTIAPTWETSNGGCAIVGEFTPIRCTATQIWARALRDGAPPAALARIELASEQHPLGWSFRIEDAPRKIRFVKTYPDDCELMLEKESDIAATGLERAMIVTAVGAVKDRIKACSMRSHGTVMARVEVAATGGVR